MIVLVVLAFAAVDDWIDAIVFPKGEKLEIRDGDAVVGVFSSKARVLREDGDWLEVRHDEGPSRPTATRDGAALQTGRVRKSEVVKLAEAVDYFTKRIADDPKSAWPYLSRSGARRAKGDF